MLTYKIQPRLGATSVTRMLNPQGRGRMDDEDMDDLDGATEETTLLDEDFCHNMLNFHSLVLVLVLVATLDKNSVVLRHCKDPELGNPIKTSISATVTEEALNGTITIKPLPIGTSVSGKVDKQSARFIGVTVFFAFAFSCRLTNNLPTSLV
ncbi:hypothetical protein Syun_009908 [Stephania yunnanensis]|uniref:Uncharacterized protein n=1 Tax=Stephania yunnanensis TaxID=152371 RepID=A0AAP0PR44_9MAGN